METDANSTISRRQNDFDEFEIMPYDYDRKQRLYRNADGNLVTRAELKATIDKLTDFIRKDAARLAGRLDADEITVAEFIAEMRELLKSGHIIAASVGRGGRELMGAADWGRVAAKIKWQYSYLEKFGRKLERGVLSKANTANRARAYTESVYISYARTFQESQSEVLEPGGKVVTDENMLCRLVTNANESCAECLADEADGWVPVAEMTDLGDRICGDFCRCTLLFEDELQSE